jgi:hypothetical protein
MFASALPDVHRRIGAVAESTCLSGGSRCTTPTRKQVRNLNRKDPPRRTFFGRMQRSRSTREQRGLFDSLPSAIKRSGRHAEGCMKRIEGATLGGGRALAVSVRKTALKSGGLINRRRMRCPAHIWWADVRTRRNQSERYPR